MPNFKPVTRDDVTDMALLPKRFDMFAAEVRASFATLGDRLLPAIARIDDALHDISHRLTRIEQDYQAVVKRVAALESKRRKANK